MSKVNLGYCCINLTLGEKGIKVGRSMIKKTFNEKGLEYAGELALQNIRDLVEIIKWNNRHGVKLYRMSSNMFPWMSEYELKDLPTYYRIKNLLMGAGHIARKAGQRITFHPGHFCVIASLNPNVVKKSMKELNQHGEIMDLMGFPRTHDYPINVHVNSAQGGKEDAMKRFCDSFIMLDESVRKRLVVENDDKKAQYSVKDLKEGISDVVGCPVMFDYHHHWCYEDPMPVKEAFELARSTWPEGIKQCTHYSSCKKIHEDTSVMNRAHADYIYEDIPTFGYDVDVELEAKAKELAFIKYQNKEFPMSISSIDPMLVDKYPVVRP